MCWHAIALRRLHMEDYPGYNQAMLEVIILRENIVDTTLQLQDKVKERIEGMKQARLDGVKAQYDEVQTKDLTSHRSHSGETYKIAGWIHDPASNRQVLQARLMPTSTWDKVFDVSKTAAWLTGRYVCLLTLLNGVLTGILSSTAA